MWSPATDASSGSPRDGVPGGVPDPLVDDVEQASAFYCSTLGFEEAYRNEDEHGVEFVFLSLEPYGIGLGRRADGETRDVALWIYADDVDAAAADLRAAGATEVLAADGPAVGRADVLVRRPERPPRPHRCEGRVSLCF